jgi:hypothetical protein
VRVNLNICLDFDGVLHDHSGIKFDGKTMGQPMVGALAAVTYLRELGHHLVISTCRLNDREREQYTEWKKSTSEYRPMRQPGNHVTAWLDYFNFPPDIEVTFEKPIAHLYIDDRGCRFSSWAHSDVWDVIERVSHAE